MTTVYARWGCGTGEEDELAFANLNAPKGLLTRVVMCRVEATAGGCLIRRGTCFGKGEGAFMVQLELMTLRKMGRHAFIGAEHGDGRASKCTHRCGYSHGHGIGYAESAYERGIVSARGNGSGGLS